MIRITRDKEGKHFIAGIPFRPSGFLRYRKKTLAKAMQVMGPFSVETPEGTMEGKAGDWLMVGVNGGMYPCDADVFAKTYEFAPPSMVGKSFQNMMRAWADGLE